MTASGSEIARQGKKVSRAFADGFAKFVGNSKSGSSDRERALAIASAAIGAVIVSRSVAKAEPKLADEILAASRLIAGEMAGLRSK
ncbi:MAG: hypothetical protein ABI431_10015 [Candidatus Tumulicola sp.]